MQRTSNKPFLTLAQAARLFPEPAESCETNTDAALPIDKKRLNQKSSAPQGRHHECLSLRCMHLHGGMSLARRTANKNHCCHKAEQHRCSVGQAATPSNNCRGGFGVEVFFLCRIFQGNNPYLKSTKANKSKCFLS